MTRTLIITNKHRVPGSDYAELRAISQEHMPDSRIVQSATPQEAAMHIEHEDPQNLFIVGGDGSLNQALEHAIADDLVLGIIPHGTGNDHARTLGFKGKPDTKRIGRTLDYLRPFIATSQGDRTHLRWVDVGLFTTEDGKERYFANSLGLDYFAAVNLAVHQYNGQEKPYLRLALRKRREQAKRNPDTFKIKIRTRKGWEEHRMASASLDVLIGEYFGNGKRINPHGRIDDGEAEIIMLKDASPKTVFTNMLRVMSGSEKHLTAPGVIYLQGVKELEVRYDDPQALQYDGEALEGVREAYARILPRAIRMVENS